MSGRSVEQRTAEQRAAYRKQWLESPSGRDYKRKERNRYRTTATGADREIDRKDRHRERKNDTSMESHTFVGVDGEGWTDAAGTHHYMMIIAGDKHLYTGAPLKSLQSLAFLATLPVRPHQFYVSFFFDYDSTMILRDLARAFPDKMRELFAPSKPGTMVWFPVGERSIGIEYRPKRHLAVKLWSDNNDTKRVVIHDVQGFFQSSFVAALDKFDIGTVEQRNYIRAMKNKRDSFTTEEADDILAYSLEECRLLADLVSQLRDHSAAAKINAEPYEGPGAMAQRALNRYYGKARHEAVMERTPQLIMDRASRAYYGGRFEILTHGPINGPVYEYDLKSAYPYAMADLPCFAHGHWSSRKVSPIGISEITWNYDSVYYGEAMPYPLRDKNGRISYPVQGHGWYWNHEVIFEGKDSECTTVHNTRWWHQMCDHHPFRWIHSVYHEREHLEAQAKGSGIALKLMMNTLYGKCAQQRPVPGQFLNMLHASYITSRIRAILYERYQQAPDFAIVMFATDAIFSRVPLGIETANPYLGDFELANTFDDLTIFQPGVYFDGDRAAFKTRGVPKQVFRDNAPRLRAISTRWLEPCVCGPDETMDYHCPVHYPVRLDTHLGLRLALSRGTESAMSSVGNWVSITKRMTPDPRGKRSGDTMDHNGALYSGPIANHNWTHLVKDHGSSYPIGKGSVAELIRMDDELISDGYYEGDFADD